MEKSKYKNDQNGMFYQMADLHLGMMLNLNKQKFQIISAD